MGRRSRRNRKSRRKGNFNLKFDDGNVVIDLPIDITRVINSYLDPFEQEVLEKGKFELLIIRPLCISNVNEFEFLEVSGNGESFIKKLNKKYPSDNNDLDIFAFNINNMTVLRISENNYNDYIFIPTDNLIHSLGLKYKHIKTINLPC